jgi:DNA polymerase-1
MNKPILVLDVSYLAYRSWHAMGELSHKGQRTEVIFGVLRDILTFQEVFDCKRIVFAFDVGKSFRCVDYPGYKASRYVKNDERPELQKQLRLLRKEILPDIGFRNILWQKGYEADDLIASFCLNIPKNREVIIVSADKDLYQLLNHNVVIYNPQSKSTMDKQAFVEKFKVEPSSWADVKAIAGCKTDEVDGVAGVAEITAAKFLTGQLDNQSKAFAAIVTNNHIWKRNLPIVSIPYPGTLVPDFWKDEVTVDRWQKVMKRYGIQNLPSISTVERKGIKRS